MRVRSWELGIGIVAMVLCAVLVFQLRTESRIRDTLPTRQINELAKMFKNQNTMLEKFERENRELRQQLNGYDRDREIMRLRMAAGLIAVTGKGVQIVLSDSPKKLSSNEDPIFFIVHYDQLELLVNELWAAGAEAVAVNGHRVTNSSGFSCAGTVILIDTKRLAPPYKIEAIGDPENLKNALMMPGGFVETQILSYNLKFLITPEDDLVVPASTGISFEFAKPAEEEN